MFEKKPTITDNEEDTVTKISTTNQGRMNKYNPLPVLEKKPTRQQSKKRLAPTPNLPGVDKPSEADEKKNGLETISGVEIMLGPLPSDKQPNPQAGQRIIGPSRTLARHNQGYKEFYKSLPRLPGNKKLEKLGKLPKELVAKRAADDTKIDSDRNHVLGKAKKDDGGEGSNEVGPASGWKWYSRSMPGYSEGKTKTNQDMVFVDTKVKGDASCGLFAVFDGHGSLGHKVSSFLKASLQGRSLKSNRRIVSFEIRSCQGILRV